VHSIYDFFDSIVFIYFIKKKKEILLKKKVMSLSLNSTPSANYFYTSPIYIRNDIIQVSLTVVQKMGRSILLFIYISGAYFSHGRYCQA